MPHSKPSRGRGGRDAQAGAASQRQLRAGELVRHSLAQILREVDVADPRLQGVSVTVTEVRCSPDLRHATCFVEPLGGGAAASGLAGTVGERADVVIDGLNHAARFLRGELGRRIDMKFTPDLHFIHDPSFDEAARMNALFAKPEVARDLESQASPTGGSVGEADGGGDVAAHSPLRPSGPPPPEGEV